MQEQLKDAPFSTYYDIRSILRDVLKAIEYLHALSQPIIYNNLSDLTIIINKEKDEFHAVLTDFSAARLFLQDSPSKILSLDFRYLPSETMQARIISKHTQAFPLLSFTISITLRTPPRTTHTEPIRKSAHYMARGWKECG